MVGNFIKKESLTQVLSCEFFKISKNATFFMEDIRTTASEKSIIFKELGKLIFSVLDFSR